MNLTKIPPELMYIILDFLSIRDIRILNKIQDLEDYRPIFHNYIKKDLEKEKKFLAKCQQKKIISNIEKDIQYLKSELSSRISSYYLINVYKDKLDFYETLQKLNLDNKDISRLVKRFYKIVKIMIDKYGNQVTKYFVSPLVYKPTINDVINFRIYNQKTLFNTII